MLNTPEIIDSNHGVVVRAMSTGEWPHGASLQIGCRSLEAGTFEPAYRIVHTFTGNGTVTLGAHGGRSEWIASYVGQTLPDFLDVEFLAASEPEPAPAPPSLEERLAALERAAGEPRRAQHR